MKKFLVILILIMAATFAKADTIDLLSGGYSRTDSYSFDQSSGYASFYAPNGGLGLIETEAYGSGGYAYLEAYNGNTPGSITHFGWAGIYASSWGNVGLSNPTFDVTTGVFTGSFVSGTTTWNLVEVFGPATNASYYTDGYYSYTYSSSNLTSATATSVPEPGTLSLLGTGIFALAGFARRRFFA